MIGEFNTEKQTLLPGLHSRYREGLTQEQLKTVHPKLSLLPSAGRDQREIN